MAGITELGTTFNLPNYTGELMGLTPAETPLFSAIGGLTGGKSATAKEFEWQFYDLRTPGQNVALEGDDAPTAENRVRSNETNVVQIHQETVGVSYTKLAATGAKAGVNNDLSNPVTAELDWQTSQMFKQIARDVNWSFINGSYAKPGDNLTPRKTRGLLEAITTNKTDAVGAPLTAAMIDGLLKSAYDNGGISDQATATLLCNSSQKIAVTKAYTDAFSESSRTVGGVSTSTVITNFGVLNVMLDRAMPQDVVAVVSLEQLAPVFLEVPGKGHFFAEPLAKTGSSDNVQFYGEIGLEYGNEKAHGFIENLA